MKKFDLADVMGVMCFLLLFVAGIIMGYIFFKKHNIEEKAKEVCDPFSYIGYNEKYIICESNDSEIELKTWPVEKEK